MENNLRKWMKIVEAASMYDSPEYKRLLKNLKDAQDDYETHEDEIKKSGDINHPIRQRTRRAREEFDNYVSANEEDDYKVTLPDDDGSNSIYHHYKPRGGFTPDKIRKHLKTISSSTSNVSLKHLYDEKGRSAFAKEIRRFSSPQEFHDHLFFHGTGGYVSGGLKPGSILPASTEFGGGYGEGYSVISLSKSMNIASRFTGQSRSGMIYPVLLKKGAKVISLPKVTDSQELEDILPELWTRKIDAVKIGDWSNENSEQEICIVNPGSIIIGRGDSFAVFNKKLFSNPSEEEIEDIYNQAINPPSSK